MRRLIPPWLLAIWITVPLGTLIVVVLMVGGAIRHWLRGTPRTSKPVN